MPLRHLLRMQPEQLADALGVVPAEHGGIGLVRARCGPSGLNHEAHILLCAHGRTPCANSHQRALRARRLCSGSRILSGACHAWPGHEGKSDRPVAAFPTLL